MNAPKTIQHKTGLCVVGGGMAGVCVALAAARHGQQVILMHDRPVLGGNASSECRVHIQGADRNNGIPNMRETGILEELRLENLFRNPDKSFSVWDTLLYEKLHFEPNITLLLNCSCCEADAKENQIHSVTGWQTTTQTRHTVCAGIYADCSGDSILAPLVDARFRSGREARSEFNESIAPEQADDRTMGMTCLFQAREYPIPRPFTPPTWANRYENCDELPGKAEQHSWLHMGYWWIELGGDQDSIHDTETIRDQLLKITYGVWDHIKNRCPKNQKAAENWALDWIQFLPAKRESRRYEGDYILNQNDVEAEGRFDDCVAYGGWTMDDHHPAGFLAVKLGAPPTIFHNAPSPYGIPYRSLYSSNIVNLMFAGRNTSCTHAAMSSTRVMGTCCSMGQAAGTAAAMTLEKGISPRDVGQQHIHELQQTLIYDDCYIPWLAQEIPELSRTAQLRASSGDPEPVRNGINRPVGDTSNCWECSAGDILEYTFATSQRVEEVMLVLNSALDQNIIMSHHPGSEKQLTHVPSVLPRTFTLEGYTNNSWHPIHSISENIQRLVRLPVNRELEAIRFTLEATWGAPGSSVFAYLVR